MKSYTFNVYRTITIDSIEFYFSKKSYMEFIEKTELYDLDRDSVEVVLTYCNTFKVI